MMTVDCSVERKFENMEEKGTVCAVVAVGMRTSGGDLVLSSRPCFIALTLIMPDRDILFEIPVRVLTESLPNDTHTITFNVF
jgi:hypothetical protein